MLQGDSTDDETGDVFEKRLLGGRIKLLHVFNRNCIDGEFSAVFYPAKGALANVPCLLKPSFFADFLRAPRKPIWNEDYSRLPPGSTFHFPAVVSGNALECEFSAKSQNPTALQADPTTLTKNVPRRRVTFPSRCHWLRSGRRNPQIPHRRCIPHQAPPLHPAPSK